MISKWVAIDKLINNYMKMVSSIILNNIFCKKRSRKLMLIREFKHDQIK